ncbi:hypothetical protein SDC9_145416 [bioreactor metagenome]|uniref:Uncharacterized protein n=1 Tax=bioreactor metagenome TaxID=1076179 RepID=A0A645EC46_9ZZZZ
MTDPQRVHGEFGGDDLARIRNDLGEQVVIFIQRPAAEAVTIKANLQQGFGTLQTQIFIATALYHGVDARTRSLIQLFLFDEAQVFFFTFFSPLNGTFNGDLLLRLAFIHVSAVVQANDHVAAKTDL